MGGNRRPRHRFAFAAILLAILLASCGPASPFTSLTVNGVAVAGLRQGESYGNRCGGGVGHGIPAPNPVTVPSSGSLELVVASGPETTEIVGSLFSGETPMGEPVQFTFQRDSARHVLAGVAAGSYYLIVRVEWARPWDRGSESWAFRLDVREP